MVGIVLVSHSRALAEAVKKLVVAMTGEDVPLVVAAGAGENHDDLGTDAMEILSAIQSVDSPDGVVVLMDMGSAVLSAETALDFLDETQRSHVHLCSAPFVEGAVAAGVAAKLGNSARDIIAEASGALQQKREHLHEEVATSAPASVASATGISIRVTLPNPMGLHARPAARLAQESARFQADIHIRNLTSGKGPTSARSMTGLVTLEARKNHEIEITASGPQEKEALACLKEFVESGLGDSLEPVSAPASEKKVESRAAVKEATQALGISTGIAVGRLFFPGETAVAPPEHSAADVDAEVSCLRDTLHKTALRMKKEAAAVTRQLGASKGEIFTAQVLVLEDPMLIERAENLISHDKYNAARAWWQVICEAVKSYLLLDDEMLRQRAADLQDVGYSVLRELGCEAQEKIELPEPGIIVVRELTPGQVSQLDEEKVRGVICLEGGKTSHSAILLRSRGIPAVAQASRVQPPLEAGGESVMAIINGETGEIRVNPDKAALEKVEAQQAALRETAAREKEESAKPAVTRSGRTIEVAANVGNLSDAEAAAANGADGIGLLRTEFLFMERDEAPGEDEQFETLSAIARAMQGKPVVVRTLDAGGDKDLPYLHLPKEENPFLGVRAIRLCLRRRELFQTQLRAILRAGTVGDVRVMFPMITALEELTEAKAELVKAHESLVADNIPHLWPIPTGMMMEVPSAALLAPQFAEQVAFFSIGTNDLTQYTLAVDRGNTELQELSDTRNPAVLALIERIVQAAKAKQIPVAVCGEAAADPKIAPILLSLGVDELSMSPRAIPAAKQLVRQQE